MNIFCKLKKIKFCSTTDIWENKMGSGRKHSYNDFAKPNLKVSQIWETHTTQVKVWSWSTPWLCLEMLIKLC